MSETPDDALIFDYDLDQSPPTVWRALTEPDLVAEWLDPGEAECAVIEATPDSRLSYSWRDGGVDSVVTFEVTPANDGGSHLRVIHGGFVRQSQHPFGDLKCAA